MKKIPTIFLRNPDNPEQCVRCSRVGDRLYRACEACIAEVVAARHAVSMPSRIHEFDEADERDGYGFTPEQRELVFRQHRVMYRRGFNDGAVWASILWTCAVIVVAVWFWG